MLIDKMKYFFVWYEVVEYFKEFFFGNSSVVDKCDIE